MIENEMFKTSLKSYVLLKNIYIKNQPKNYLSPKFDHVYGLSKAIFENTVNPFPFKK